MRSVKRLNAALWVVNVLLVVVVAAMTLQLLEAATIVLPAPPVPVPLITGHGPVRDYRAFRDLSNPLRPPQRPPGQTPAGPTELRGVKLIGIDRIAGDPKSGVAYLLLVAKGTYCNAYVGEPVVDPLTGLEIPDLAGWKLVIVETSGAVFTNGQKEVVLPLDEPPATVTAAPGGPPGVITPVASGTWDKSRFAQTRTLRTTENMEVWEVDRDEVAWLGQNWETALQGVQLSPYSGGGLRIDALPDGTPAAERGFRSGDVIRMIDGQPIDSPDRLQKILQSRSRNQTTLTVVVDRSGRSYTLQYTISRQRR